MKKQVLLVVAFLLCLVSSAWLLFGAFTDKWDETVPTKRTFVRDLDKHIRDYTKRAIRERLAVDHYFIAVDDTSADTVGYHKAVHFLDQSSDPDTHAYGGVLYSKSGDAYWRDRLGNIVRITSGGALATTETGLVADVVLTDTASYIEVTGLDGDADGSYEVLVYANQPVSVSSYGYFCLNSASQPDNIYTTAMKGTYTGMKVVYATAFAGLDAVPVLPWSASSTGTWHQVARLTIINAATGSPRSGTFQAAQVGDPTSDTPFEPCVVNGSFVWDDDTTPLTSILFVSTGNLGIGSRMTVWRRR